MQCARDILNRYPVVVLSTYTVTEAAELLNALDQRFLPVVDEQQLLVGTFTDRELSRVWRSSSPLEPAQRVDTLVAAVMNRECLVLDPDADLAEIADFMIDQGMPVVPITDAAHRLLGVVTYAEVLRELSVH